jgi:histidinol dehydrogenase
MMLQPEKIDDLAPERYQKILKRSRTDIASVLEEVGQIVRDVRENGETVFLDYFRKEFKLDLEPDDLEVGDEEIADAYRSIDPKLIDALKTAAQNITTFHRAQMEREMWLTDVAEGIMAGRMITPLEKVGAYIPGGRAVYPSSILMTILPATVAGVEQIIACTPPGKGMGLDPVTLVAADISGPVRVFKVGGPWAIAAMAYGTETIPKVHKIVGPGNRYVTAAKMTVFGEVSIDSPAGPSEGMVLADQTGNANLIAIDLLSQAEHDPDSAAVLVTPSTQLAARVCESINERLPRLSRKEILQESLGRHSCILVAEHMDQAIGFVNEYAPEHLEIMTEEPFTVLKKIRNAGSIFLGPFSPIAAGDYASGTNHVLPTGQTARMFSGLSVDDFVKKPTFQHLSKEGLSLVKDAVIALAEAEGLPLHAQALHERFK